MPAAEISSLVSSFGALKDLALALVGERDRHKAASIEADFTKRLLETQSQLQQVLSAVIDKDQTIHTLMDRVRKLEADQAERERYRLANVGSIGQFFAYQLRPAIELSTRADEPTHFLCQPCFDAGQKSVLNFPGIHAKCSTCDRLVQIQPSPPQRPLRSTLSPGIGGRDW